MFAGGDLNYQGRGAVQVQGISATPTAAHNLRGVNIPVADGLKELTVSFPMPEADAAYGILKIFFDKAAPAGGGTLDWLLVR